MAGAWACRDVGHYVDLSMTMGCVRCFSLGPRPQARTLTALKQESWMAERSILGCSLKLNDSDHRVFGCPHLTCFVQGLLILD